MIHGKAVGTGIVSPCYMNGRLVCEIGRQYLVNCLNQPSSEQGRLQEHLQG